MWQKLELKWAQQTNKQSMNRRLQMRMINRQGAWKRSPGCMSLWRILETWNLESLTSSSVGRWALQTLSIFIIVFWWSKLTKMAGIYHFFRAKQLTKLEIKAVSSPFWRPISIPIYPGSTPCEKSCNSSQHLGQLAHPNWRHFSLLALKVGWLQSVKYWVLCLKKFKAWKSWYLPNATPDEIG